jgi:eukaryotic-like serine/threonine-protein kinase
VNAEATLLEGRYRLVERIGAGGLAVVWRATDTVLDREVAVKRLRTDVLDDETRRRFQQEAVTAAGIDHPNAVTVYDLGEHDGRSHLVMELIEGPDLAELIEEEAPLPAGIVAAIGEQAARALGAAHRRGLIHRDVKPANILVSPSGTVKVTDFGIAKAMGGAETRLTAAGTVMGTAIYLAPEQLEDADLDVRTDVYALGIVLWEALVGRPPFEGGSAAEVALARLRREVPPPSEKGADVPTELDEIVVRATRRDRDTRYADAGELAEALAPLADPDAREHLTQMLRRDARTAVLGWLGLGDGNGDGTRTGEPPTVGGRGEQQRRQEDARTDPRPRAGSGAAGAGAGSAVEPDAAATAGTGEGSNRTRLAVIAAIVLLAGALLLAVVGVPETISPAPDPEPVEVASVTDFDPYGGGEHGDRAANVVDGDAGTTWITQRYNSADLGGLKPGVGLHFDLGEAREVVEVEVVLASPGLDVELHAFENGPEPDAGAWGEPTDRVEDAPEELTFTVEDVGAAQHWVLWITELPSGGGGHRGEIAEVRFLAR